MNPTAHNALIATLGTILGLVVGSMTVFTFLEKRIQERATDKTSVDMRIQELKMQNQKLDARTWDDRNEIRSDMREMKSDFNALRERMLKIEYASAK